MAFPPHQPSLKTQLESRSNGIKWERLHVRSPVQRLPLRPFRRRTIHRRAAWLQYLHSGSDDHPVAAPISATSKSACMDGVSWDRESSLVALFRRRRVAVNLLELSRQFRFVITWGCLGSVRRWVMGGFQSSGVKRKRHIMHWGW